MSTFSICFFGVIVFGAPYENLNAFPPPPQSVRGSNSQKDDVSAPQPGSQEAYVTVVYGNFPLGTRVLGQSLRETGTKKDLIALCTKTVSDEDKKVLESDGWIVHPIEDITFPYERLSSRGNYLSDSFSKVHVWNMTEYRRIVFLDSDIIVQANIDRMFNCGTFCATCHHSSNFFDAGVLVIKPSKAIFNDIIGKISEFASFDDADQGFFNVYFKNLIYAPLFNWSDDTKQQQLMRLPLGLNLDTGTFYVNQLTYSDEVRDIRIVHYSGFVKPWCWWNHFLFDLTWRWTDVRERLPQYPGYSDTYHPTHLPLFWVPYPILALLYAGMKFCEQSSRRYSSDKDMSALKHLLHFLPLPILFLSYYLAYKLIVPTTMVPTPAGYIFLLWSNFFFLAFVRLYRYLCWNCRRNNHHGTLQKKLILYIVFVASSIAVMVVPAFVQLFLNRVKIFAVLLGIHFLVGQVMGMLMIAY